MRGNKGLAHLFRQLAQTRIAQMDGAEDMTCGTAVALDLPENALGEARFLCSGRRGENDGRKDTSEKRQDRQLYGLIL